MLPVSSASHRSQPFIDSLFVATSGISTTGLTPVDISRDYSLWGQIILLIDFQIGGIGYMAIVVWLAVFLKRRLSIKSHLVATESLAGAQPGNNRYFFRNVIALTIFFEFTAAVILAAFWARHFPLPKALYFGIFHSVSAFCTAGFSLFSDSLASYQGNLLINAVISVTSLFGAIGFFVLSEFAHKAGDRVKRRPIRKRLSTHARLAILVTSVILLAGTAVIYFSESRSEGSGAFQRLMASLFQTISASTTDGFNTVNIAGMSITSLIMIMMLMFIGASPGSTGGGIKTTTFGVIALSIKSQIMSQKNINFFKHQIPDEVIRRSYLILSLSISVVIIDMLILSRTEDIPFLSILFETISALGNTGLSMGATSSLSWVGKLLLCVTMFIGRVGPITIGLALAGERKPAHFQYADGEIFTG
ncbi:MAG: Trk family potassium uptake protein [Candidatus Aminicenantes bacterium]|nr:Trk family potassium uptake protein [Candidatus Aminicenantes bacterium]